MSLPIATRKMGKVEILVPVRRVRSREGASSALKGGLSR